MVLERLLKHRAALFSKVRECLNDAEYHLKNYGDRGGCYPPRPIRP